MFPWLIPIEMVPERKFPISRIQDFIPEPRASLAEAVMHLELLSGPFLADASASYKVDL